MSNFFNYILEVGLLNISLNDVTNDLASEGTTTKAFVKSSFYCLLHKAFDLVNISSAPGFTTPTWARGTPRHAIGLRRTVVLC